MKWYDKEAEEATIRYIKQLMCSKTGKKRSAHKRAVARLKTRFRRVPSGKSVKESMLQTEVGQQWLQNKRKQRKKKIRC